MGNHAMVVVTENCAPFQCWFSRGYMTTGDGYLQRPRHATGLLNTSFDPSKCRMALGPWGRNPLELGSDAGWSASFGVSSTAFVGKVAGGSDCDVVEGSAGMLEDPACWGSGEGLAGLAERAAFAGFHDRY